VYEASEKLEMQFANYIVPIVSKSGTQRNILCNFFKWHLRQFYLDGLFMQPEKRLVFKVQSSLKFLTFDPDLESQSLVFIKLHIIP